MPSDAISSGLGAGFSLGGSPLGVGGPAVPQLRTYGRVTNEDGTRVWVEVTTDSNGYNDLVWLTTLAQVCKGNLGESPFFADWGIPARSSIMQQIAPDYNMYLIQQRFSQYFASLQLIKTNNDPPTYQINAITHQGVVLRANVPIPQ